MRKPPLYSVDYDVRCKKPFCRIRPYRGYPWILFNHTRNKIITHGKYICFPVWRNTYIEPTGNLSSNQIHFFQVSRAQDVKAAGRDKNQSTKWIVDFSHLEEKLLVRPTPAAGKQTFSILQQLCLTCMYAGLPAASSCLVGGARLAVGLLVAGDPPWTSWCTTQPAGSMPKTNVIRLALRLQQVLADERSEPAWACGIHFCRRFEQSDQTANQWTFVQLWTAKCSSVGATLTETPAVATSGLSSLLTSRFAPQFYLCWTWGMRSTSRWLSCPPWGRAATSQQWSPSMGRSLQWGVEPLTAKMRGCDLWRCMTWRPTSGVSGHPW